MFKNNIEIIIYSLKELNVKKLINDLIKVSKNVESRLGNIEEDISKITPPIKKELKNNCDYLN